MSNATSARRDVPKKVYALRLGERIKWARKSAGISHDRLVEKIGRSNRGHLIKVEQGTHTPGADLRDALADALNVPRDLFADEDDAESRDPVADLMNALRVMVDEAVARQAVGA